MEKLSVYDFIQDAELRKQERKLFLEQKQEQKRLNR